MKEWWRPTHVLQSAAKRARALADFQPFAEAEIDELHVTVAVQQNVLGLQVAVHDARIVKKICGSTEFWA